MKIEIYNKKTGEVIEKKDIGDSIRGFLCYWSMQCDTKTYAWRQVKSDDTIALFDNKGLSPRGGKRR